MAEVKQQKIMVLLALNLNDKNLILNGIRLAEIFRKELCLLCNLSKKEKPEKERIKIQLANYVAPIKTELPLLKVSSLILSETALDLPEKLSDDYEAILVLAAASDFRKHSKSLAESSIPFLFVHENRDQIPDYKKLILPMDWRTENSDSALWGANFGRFNGSGIVIVAANDSAKTEQKLVAKNVALTRKLYQKFNIEHKVFKGSKSSFKNAFEALELAKDSGSDLMLLLGSSHITPLDWLIGLPEKKILKRAGDLPLLIVNPRKDNYILCD